MARKRSARKLNVEVQVYLFEQDDQWVAYGPALELCSYGDTPQEARRRFSESLEITLEYMMEHGTLDDELTSLGWTLKRSHYIPPKPRPNAMAQYGSPTESTELIDLARYLNGRASNAAIAN